MKSENKVFKTKKSLITFVQKIFNKYDDNILILGNQQFVDTIADVQKEYIKENIPIEEEIPDSDIEYSVALIEEDYIEMIKNYNITKEVYVITCNQLLDEPKIKSINKSSVTHKDNVSNIKVEYTQDENTTLEEQQDDIDNYLDTMVEAVLETDLCSGCIKEILSSVFATGWNLGIVSEKAEQIEQLNADIMNITDFLNGENGDENGDGYLN